uniref:Uncharacterized protein n=1 Tax=Sciurus vulgaris TaxID=55149 RepID=A0A8D2DHT3_SCIVU
MEAGEGKELLLKQRKHHTWNHFPNRTCSGFRCRKQSPKLHNQPQFLLSSY